MLKLTGGPRHVLVLVLGDLAFRLLLSVVGLALLPAVDQSALEGSLVRHMGVKQQASQ